MGGWGISTTTGKPYVSREGSRYDVKVPVRGRYSNRTLASETTEGLAENSKEILGRTVVEKIPTKGRMEWWSQGSHDMAYDNVGNHGLLGNQEVLGKRR